MAYRPTFDANGRQALTLKPGDKNLTAVSDGTTIRTFGDTVPSTADQVRLSLYRFQYGPGTSANALDDIRKAQINFGGGGIHTVFEGQELVLDGSAFSLSSFSVAALSPGCVLFINIDE